LEYALDLEGQAVFRAGVWGGLTAIERAYESEARNDDTSP
jgi:hypothetical protein